MKGKAIVAGIASVLVGSVAYAAEPFDSKLQAAVFNTKLVQAVDECATGTTTIGGVDACSPMNTTTASVGNQFSVGKILVKSKLGPTQVLAILKSSGNGDTKKDLATTSLRVKLTLRVTKRTTAANPTDPVTWVDQELLCAPVTVPANGNFLFKGSLVGAGCGLDTDLANEAFQKEVVSASIIENGSGLNVAVPGVRKKPPL
jgi:hypothetical protein